MATMRLWTMNAVGRDNLRQDTAAVPSPARGEILVKVAAVSLNYRDKLVIETGMGLPLTFPFVPASDMAGTVVELGEGTTRFKVGERVISTFRPGWIDGPPSGTARVPPYETLGGIHPGVLAEYVAFPEDWFSQAPKTLDDAEASTLPCAGLTAWFALVERGDFVQGRPSWCRERAASLCSGSRSRERRAQTRSFFRRAKKSSPAPRRSGQHTSSIVRKKIGLKPSIASPATAVPTTLSK
jgi:NADPH:quinone reductase-like Zn-dependent oxidoreductase